jgi:phosphoribosylanthranilate isomerase
MANPVSVKICGISTVDDVRACAGAGANYMGLVFFEKSPRNITIPAARDLALAAPVGLAKVALVVNPSDAELDAIAGTVPLDMIQLHGRETPERVAEVKARYGLPVMKAVGICGCE